MTAWSHLPNAHLIDRILSELRYRPAARAAAWDAARAAAWDAARDAARAAARDAARDAAWDAARAAARAAARTAARAAARDAILALVAWDSVGELLEQGPEQVRVLAALGQPAAILVLPAVIALAVEPAIG